eukprot:430465-Prorocentrum_minimum.AAC.1
MFYGRHMSVSGARAEQEAPGGQTDSLSVTHTHTHTAGTRAEREARGDRAADAQAPGGEVCQDGLLSRAARGGPQPQGPLHVHTRVEGVSSTVEDGNSTVEGGNSTVEGVSSTVEGVSSTVEG